MIIFLFDTSYYLLFIILAFGKEKSSHRVRLLAAIPLDSNSHGKTTHIQHTWGKGDTPENARIKELEKENKERTDKNKHTEKAEKNKKKKYEKKGKKSKRKGKGDCAASDIRTTYCALV